MTTHRPSPYRGAANHMTRDSDAIVQRARELYPTVRGYLRTARALEAEAGRLISRQTIRQWIHGTTRAQT